MGVRRPDQSTTWILINSRALIAKGEASPHAVVTTFTEITQLRELRQEKERLSAELEKALTHALGGFLPICANCKSIRNEQNEWRTLETYLTARTRLQLSHGICPECMRELYPDYLPELPHNSA